MMKTDRYYCFPDIHGCSSVLKEALEFVYKENPEGGKIIFLGDYIDRGPDNLGTIRTVMNPPENWEFITLMGNHELMFLEAYRDNTPFYNIPASKDIAGFGQDEYVTYGQIRTNIPKDIIEWMTLDLKMFHIEGKNVFAHAFYDDDRSPEEQQLSECVWLRMDDFMKYDNRNQGFYLTHGHTPRKNGPINCANRTNLDAGAIFYGRFVIAEYKYTQQMPVAFHEFHFKNHLDY